MMIIGCDFHPRFQQVAFVDQDTGEFGERRVAPAPLKSPIHNEGAPGPSLLGTGDGSAAGLPKVTVHWRTLADRGPGR
jgi:hypothetical protein